MADTLGRGASVLLKKPKDKPKADKKAAATPVVVPAAAIAAPKANPKDAAAKVDKTISNYELRLKAAHQTIPAAEVKKGFSILGNATTTFLDNLDRVGNGVRNGLHYSSTGRRFLDGAEKGVKLQEHYSGTDIMNSLGVENKVGKFVGAVGAEVLLDPTNLLTLGTGSMAKGALKGAGATLSEEAAASAAKLAKVNALQATETALKTQNRASDLGELGKKLGLDAPAVKKQVAHETFKKYVPEGADIADDKVFAQALDTFKKEAAQKAQQRANEKAGAGLSIAGKTIVSGAKMQDAGAVVGNAVRKLPFVPEAEAAVSKAFSNKAIDGLDAGQRDIFAGVKTNAAGEQALKDVTDADKFKAIAALQRGVTIGGKPIDKAMLDIISTGGRGVNPADWDTVIAVTNKQKAAAQALGLPEDATLRDLGNLYTSTFKDIGMKERKAGVLSSMIDEFKPTQIKDGASFSTYVPRVLSRTLNEDAGVLRKGGMTRNFNVSNEFNTKRLEKYEGKSISEINQMIRDSYDQTGRDIPKDFEFFETSALNALMSRQLTSNKVLADRKFVDNILGTFGERISTTANLGKWMDKGFDIVVPVAKVNLYNVGKIAKKGLDDAIPVAGDSKSIQRILESHGDVLAKISAQDAANFIGKVDMPVMYALPHGISQNVNKAARIQLAEQTNILAAIADKFYSKWKPLVTGLNAKYHMRNLSSSSFNNFLDLGKDMFDAETQKGALAVAGVGGGVGRSIKINIRGKDFTSKAIHDMMVENGALNTFMLTDSDTLAKGLSEDVVRHEGGALLQRAITKPFETASAGGRAVGNRTEEYVRATNFISHLKQGMDAESAAEMVRKYHFDYQDITDFEKNIKRVLPFYTWARKNVPLQLESLLNDPRPYMTLDKAIRNGSQQNGDIDYSAVPDYMQENKAIPYGIAEDGRVKMLDAGLPVGDLAFGAKDFASMVNPLIKTPAEIYFNQSVLTGSPLNKNEQSAANRLVQGNSVISKGINMIPNADVALRNHPTAATWLEQGLNATGIINDMSKYAAPVVPKDGVVVGHKDRITAGGAAGFAQRMTDPNFVKYYSPEKGELNQQYARQRQLANLVQSLKEQGIDIKTKNELKRKY